MNDDIVAAVPDRGERSNPHSAIQIDEWRDGQRAGAPSMGGPSAAYRVLSYHRIPSVNTRTIKLWRDDNRYHGYMFVRRHESGGIELSRDALRSGAKAPAPIIVDPDSVDALILSLLEVRQRR